MMENIASFAHVTRTIRAFAGNLPYRLIASGLGLDTGPYGPPSPNPDNSRRTMVRMDPRHRGLFGAAWTLATIAGAARGGLQAVSPAALAGEFGIVHRPLGYDQPWFDRLDRAAVYPVYHVVSAMAHAAGRPVIDTIASDPTRIAALAYRPSHGGLSLWLANLRDKPQPVLLPRIEGSPHVRLMDESTFEAAALDSNFLQARGTALSGREIEIGAYGIARIEIGD
jgi:hypothetical protein